jgi:hypothetical protein
VVPHRGGVVKGRLVRAAGRFSVCAQTETSPYSYVSVEGGATISQGDLETHVRPLARRYLGPDGGDVYAARAAASPPPMRVAMTPERWWTVDYSKATA